MTVLYGSNFIKQLNILRPDTLTTQIDSNYYKHTLGFELRERELILRFKHSENERQIIIYGTP
uniref:Uncharacterized protein n=1 Tax=Picea glauca TaxID=3330 RepID=A0A101LWI9_PICGL|nr:hypothetical protein ABT39_MTgene1324 [Picea glauca]QHR89525.1 hypothetical protein Q903MT_gene3547 [Picea sitchensis]